MDSEVVMALGKDAIMVTLLLAAPLMIVGLAVGLAVGIFQTVTSIQESTLAYIPKMIAVFVALLVAMPWLLQTAVGYTARLFGNLHTFIR